MLRNRNLFEADDSKMDWSGVFDSLSIGQKPSGSAVLRALEGWWTERDEKANLFLTVKRSNSTRNPAGFREGTVSAKIRQVLLSHSKPMSPSAIQKALPGENPLTIFGALRGQHIRHKIFVRTAPGMYGLLEWRSKPPTPRSR